MKVLCSLRDWPICGEEGAADGKGRWAWRCSVIEEMEVVTLEDEDGIAHRFSVVDIVEVEDRRYAVLLPEDEEDAAAVIFRVETPEHLVPIEDDDELSRVVAALEETAGYGEIILEEGGEDRDDLDVLDDLAGEAQANGDRADDEDEEDE